MLYLQRRQAQSAADAASLAGAYALYNSSGFSMAQSAAMAVARQNGFTIPASYVTQHGTTQIAVKVSSSPPRFFSELWGDGSLTLSASATSQARSGSTGTVTYSTASIILLNPSASGSLYFAGSDQVHSPRGIQVNSNSPTAVNANNPGGTAADIDVVGSYTTSSGGFLSGMISSGVSSVGDPLASLQAPPIRARRPIRTPT